MDTISDRILWSELLDLTLDKIGCEISAAQSASSKDEQESALERAAVMVRAAHAVSFQLEQAAAE